MQRTARMEHIGSRPLSVRWYTSIVEDPNSILKEVQSSQEVMSWVVPRLATLVQTTLSGVWFNINAVLKWERWFQTIYFDQGKKIHPNILKIYKRNWQANSSTSSWTSGGSSESSPPTSNFTGGNARVPAVGMKKSSTKFWTGEDISFNISSHQASS